MDDLGVPLYLGNDHLIRNQIQWTFSLKWFLISLICFPPWFYLWFPRKGYQWFPNWFQTFSHLWFPKKPPSGGQTWGILQIFFLELERSGSILYETSIFTSGWWLGIPTPLKRIWLRQLGWWQTPNISGKIKLMATKPPTRQSHDLHGPWNLQNRPWSWPCRPPQGLRPGHRWDKFTSRFLVGWYFWGKIQRKLTDFFSLSN